MPLLIIDTFPSIYAVNNLKCTVKLDLPKRPYVSFGAGCRRWDSGSPVSRIVIILLPSSSENLVNTYFEYKHNSY